MGFWLRKLLLGSVLVILAIVLIQNIDLFFELDFNGSSDKPDTVAVDKATQAPSNQPKSEPQKSKEHKEKYNARVDVSTNAAAEGLSKFYASINPSLSDSSTKIRHGVVSLPKPSGKLESILEARRRVIRPFPKFWQGDKQNRAFRKGHTLFQKLNEYAKDEGLELIWWLDKDLVIKDPFRINRDILHTAFQIGQAMNGHYPDGVFTYFCYKQRNIVLVDGQNSYLKDECNLLDYNQY